MMRANKSTALSMRADHERKSPTETSKDRIALLALFCGATAIGFAPIFVRLSQVGPSATAFWRLTLALPALWLWAMLEKRGSGTRHSLSSADYRRLLGAGLFFAGDLAVWHWSIYFTSVANATLLANFAPIFVVLGGWLMFGQGVGRTFLLGMGVALAGSALMVGTSFRLSLSHLWGDVLGLVTAMLYAGYLLSVKRLRDELSVATIMLWSGAVTSTALLPVALLSGERVWPVSPKGWGTLWGLALISQVGGQSLIAYALAHLPAAFSSVGLLLQPVMATIFAWLILGETIGSLQAVGGVFVLGGILAARQESRAG
jgi:drug/metabolite transporter (DMT)-like permease